MIQNWTTGGQFFLRKTASDRPEFAFVTSAQTTITGTSTTIVANTWSHVAVVRNGSSFKIYVNGVQDSATATNTGAITGTGKAVKVGIGPDDGSPLTGYISNARIVNGTAVYTANFTPPTAPLTAITNTSLLTLQNNRPTNNSVFVDSSPNNFLVTRNGNTTQGSFGPYGSNWSNYFDGTGDYLTFSAVTSPSTGDFTVEFWLYNTRSAWTTAFDITDGSSGAMAIFFGSDGNFRIAPQNQTSTSLGSVSSLPLNQWNHFAVIRSSGSIRAYANGTALAAAAAYTTGMSGFTKLGGTGDGYVLGYLSNFRYTTTAVYSISASTITVPTSPLTAITGTDLLTCQSNRFIDNSVNNFAITRNGDVSVQRFGPFDLSSSTSYSTSVIGGSGYFDGTGDYLSVPYSSSIAPPNSTSAWTVELWFFPTISSGTNVILFRIGSGSFSPIAIVLNTSNLYIDLSTSGGAWSWSTGAKAISLNTWYHVALVRNGATTTAYLNGVSYYSASSVTLWNPGANLGIGANPDGSQTFSGYISGVRVVNGDAVYTANFTPPTAPLTAITNTGLLLNFTNAGIYDKVMMNDLETVGNAQVSTSVKKYGTGSMYFDGTGDYLVGAASQNVVFGTGNFTLEGWFYPTISDDQALFDTRNSSTSTSGIAVRLLTSTNTLRVIMNNAALFTTSTAVTLNQWSHIAIVRSSGTVDRIFKWGSNDGRFRIRNNIID